ncbi:MAG TPA: hypothetical protein VFY58_01635 [Nocardioides sp.]|nr:hypothetical protein [Nocardioides sp.]
MRRAVLVAALAAALCVPASPAVADETVVVPGLAFPSSDTYLTYFGCADLFRVPQVAPGVRIGQMEAPPSGLRSFGLLMPGTGTASGPVTRVDSVASTTVAGFSARADLGATGVAYVWYATGGIGPGQAWAGRAELAVGPAWQYVDAAAATYHWTLYDVGSGRVVEDGGNATIGEFTDTHGDGPGYLLAGFGCDGSEFVMDALQFGSPGSVTTYDLEGITVSTSITASQTLVSRGTRVTLTGASVDIAGVPVGAPLVLEARPAGSAAFQPVGDPFAAGVGGSVSVGVNPDRTTTYRWYMPATGYADAGFSAPVTVRVTR